MYDLFRWRFVIHGGINGFSRMIVFLECSTNSHASTVYALFQNAVETFGLPSRMRSDKGRENYDVAWFMLSPFKKSYCWQKRAQPVYRETGKICKYWVQMCFTSYFAIWRSVHF